MTTNFSTYFVTILFCLIFAQQTIQEIKLPMAKKIAPLEDQQQKQAYLKLVERFKPYQKDIDYVAKKYEISPDLIMATMLKENYNLDPKLRAKPTKDNPNPSDYGLGQQTNKNWKDYVVKGIGISEEEGAKLRSNPFNQIDAIGYHYQTIRNNSKIDTPLESMDYRIAAYRNGAYDKLNLVNKKSKPVDDDYIAKTKNFYTLLNTGRTNKWGVELPKEGTAKIGEFTIGQPIVNNNYKGTTFSQDPISWAKEGLEKLLTPTKKED